MTAPYDAPLEEICTAIDQAAFSTGLARIDTYRETRTGIAEPILENAARFAREVLSPLNIVGDRSPACLTPEGVRTSPGFAEAYARFRADGWVALGAPQEYGGMGLPMLLAVGTGEMWAGANLSFAMCPEVATGVIEALAAHAPAPIRETYLPRIVSGEWTAAMALTEPQAGSDLSTIRTRAEPDGNTWRLFGRKTFISWGEHDLSENIVHLVLARTPDAPEGTRGLSLFLVPRLWLAENGELIPNDMRATSLEHKMGIHASPTCEMVLGEHDGARGWLIGARHEGLACMFTVMNHMRLGVGIHSLGVAERAFQLALAHARERQQGRGPDGRQRPIIEHADVRRMLLTMKALTGAARRLVYLSAATLDVSRLSPELATREAAARRLALLTPLVKAWVSDAAVEVSSLGVQVHGGTGYMNDAEISQLYRDARIGPIFEGTNYIQAQDFLARKVIRDSGATLFELLEEMQNEAAQLPATDVRLAALRSGLHTGIPRLRDAAAGLCRSAPQDSELVGSVAYHFAQWCGTLIAAWQWCLAARLALGRSDAHAQSTVDTAVFYGAHVLPRVLWHEAVVTQGRAPVVEL